MEMEIVVPDEVPAMTLPNIAFFPQALLPLHIYEPRYRQMLTEVLASDRLMAVAGLDSQCLDAEVSFEPPHRIVTVGIVRACQKAENGTSNLLLQGLCRAEIISIPKDHPYRTIKIRTLSSRTGDDPKKNDSLRHELARLLSLKHKFGALLPQGMTEFLDSVNDPETFVDLAAFSLCDNATFKQKLLETLDVSARLELFNHQLRSEIKDLRFRRRLQGDLPDNRISHN